MYKISVIMPIYNMEKYLVEAIDSVLNQTIAKDIELILIDDCSTDKTEKICKKYVSENSNIIYKRLEKNSKMAGKPRNIGMEIASAEYLMFLDPDDIYVKDICEKMYNCILDKNVNVVTANLAHMDEKGNKLDFVYLPKEIKSQYLDINNIEVANKIYTCSVYVKIVKAEYVKSKNIKFLEGLPAEDTYFSKKLFISTRKAYFLNEIVGYCRQRTTVNVSESNNLNKSFFIRLLNANKEIYEMMKSANELEYYREFYLDAMMNYLYRLLSSNSIDKADLNEIVKKCSWFLDNIKIYSYDLNIKEDQYKIMDILKSKSVEEKNKSINISRELVKDKKQEELTVNRRKIKSILRRQ